MRIILIATLLTLLPLPLYAQSRPAPDTPGETSVLEDATSEVAPSLVSALRVVVVTSGIIGGFIAADIFSGGALTAPLLLSAATISPRVATLRPIIAALPSRAASTALPEFDRAVVHELARRLAVRPSARFVPSVPLATVVR